MRVRQLALFLLIMLAAPAAAAAQEKGAAPKAAPQKAPADAPAAAAQRRVNPKSLQLNEEGVVAVKAKDFTKAEQLFRQALATDPHNVTAVFNLAGMYAANNKNEAALSLLQDYVARVPQDAGLHARLGDLYFASQKPGNAAKAYEQALALEPSYPRLHAKLATIYGLLRRLPEAERELHAAIEEEPQNADLYANLSALQLANNKLQDAIGTAKKALQLRVSSDLYVTLGTAYELSGNPKNALIAFQRAVDLGDGRPELKSKIESLKRKSTVR